MNQKRTPYQVDPDFSRRAYEVPAMEKNRIRAYLVSLYGNELADKWLPELERVMKVHYAHKPLALIDSEKSYDPHERFTEQDNILITYADAFSGDYGRTLDNLHNVINLYNSGGINTIHLLPFFPYSSDRGFAVVDYDNVDPRMGTWDSVRNIGRDYNLMFDVVMNHCSSRAEVFREFIRGNRLYRDFFIAYDSPDELTTDQRSKIFRPRTSDILTRFETISGPKYVWTTFSEDQIDFNFRYPPVLIQVIDGILMYVRRGANIIRLDAVTYLWSEPGTECVHLPQTHTIIKLLRLILDLVAPGVAIITETNVPHRENISYFGNGYDQAHMVYNFALPPLVLHTMFTEDATDISRWAASLALPSNCVTFFNILDTHDGIGLLGARGILSDSQVDALVDQAVANGALISTKSTATGEEPYEINSTWWSALNPAGCKDDMCTQVRRYFASRSIQMVLKGVPSLYTHAVLGLSNDYALVDETGVKRDINRRIIQTALFQEHLSKPGSKRAQVLYGHKLQTEIRTRYKAFHPQGGQQVLELSPRLFAVYRTSPAGDQHLLALTNVSSQDVDIDLSLRKLNLPHTQWVNLMDRRRFETDNGFLGLHLIPYEVLWLIPEEDYRKEAQMRR